jgi:HPt (histidine-containing phosphotransfer) domain-containing protein
MGEDAIDIQDVMERVQDDWELFLELLDIFVQDYSEKKALLNQAINEKNSEEIRDLIHSIKGATGNISARAMHQTCIRIERLADEKKLEQVPELLTLLDQQFSDLQRHIIKIKADYHKK